MGNPDTTKSQSPEQDEEKTSQDRLSDATSEKTVSDLEESEETSDSAPDKPSNEIPAPDGMPDPDHGSRGSDGSDAGDPM